MGWLHANTTQGAGKPWQQDTPCPGHSHVPGDRHGGSQAKRGHEHLPAPTLQGRAQLCQSSSHPTWFHPLVFLKLHYKDEEHKEHEEHKKHKEQKCVQGIN